jgi:hypothetical protein
MHPAYLSSSRVLCLRQMSAIALNAEKSYPTDLSGCREVVSSSSMGKNSAEVKGAGVGALGGARVGDYSPASRLGERFQRRSWRRGRSDRRQGLVRCGDPRSY